MNPPGSSLLDSLPESYPGVQVTWRPGDPSSSFLLLSPSPLLIQSQLCQPPGSSLDKLATILPQDLCMGYCLTWTAFCRLSTWLTPLLPQDLCMGYCLTWTVLCLVTHLVTPVHLMALFKSELPLPPASTPGPTDPTPLVYFLLSDVLCNLGIY